jgi:hypothetical protein
VRSRICGALRSNARRTNGRSRTSRLGNPQSTVRFWNCNGSSDEDERLLYFLRKAPRLRLKKCATADGNVAPAIPPKLPGDEEEEDAVIRLHDIYGYPDPYIFLYRGLKERPRHANIRHHEMPP